MNDYLGIVKLINKECNILFTKNFKLIPFKNHHNLIIYRIEGDSSALNRYDYAPIKVLSWFDKFWLFIEIKFIIQNEKIVNKHIQKIHTNISLSVYEGLSSDDRKVQLFRAEWDDMNNPSELHSQPHWHITSSQAIEKTFEKYSKQFDNGDFISLLEKEKEKLFDVKKIHFAMNGDWQNNNNHVHSIDDPVKVSKWLKGLLSHIRLELDE